MKELDEAGIPLPLAERLAPLVGTPSGRTEALELISNLDLSDIEDFDEVDRFLYRWPLGNGCASSFGKK